MSDGSDITVGNKNILYVGRGDVVELLEASADLLKKQGLKLGEYDVVPIASASGLGLIFNPRSGGLDEVIADDEDGNVEHDYQIEYDLKIGLPDKYDVEGAVVLFSTSKAKQPVYDALEETEFGYYSDESWIEDVPKRVEIALTKMIKYTSLLQKKDGEITVKNHFLREAIVGYLADRGKTVEEIEEFTDFTAVELYQRAIEYRCNGKERLSNDDSLIFYLELTATIEEKLVYFTEHDLDKVAEEQGVDLEGLVKSDDFTGLQKNHCDFGRRLALVDMGCLGFEQAAERQGLTTRKMWRGYNFGLREVAEYFDRVPKRREQPIHYPTLIEVDLKTTPEIFIEAIKPGSRARVYRFYQNLEAAT
ncbi:MAG: hypothetical protein KJ597_00185 [Nanoarchaeota archaeon]|nr:hypothetical protein [Nanoarchaeota archaeon]MBU1621972.1 hypothetical protein [Nanoarchaeota archaeon]